MTEELKTTKEKKEIQVGDVVRAKTLNGTHITGKVLRIVKSPYSALYKVDGVVGLLKPTEIFKDKYEQTD